jgi:hypothetical protein
MKILRFNGSAIEIAKMAGEFLPSVRVGRPATKGMKRPAQFEERESDIFSIHRSAKVEQEL